MKALVLAILLLPALAAAGQDAAGSQTVPAPPAQSAQTPVLRGQAGEPTAQPVQPTAPAPDVIPAAPPEKPAPPADQSGVMTQQPPSATGQWVYTAQYGWVWMPYGNAYTYVPPNGGAPDMYLYYPDVGWTWVVAPWIWGWGPMPYYGLYGTAGFGWYGYGYGRWYGYAGPYAGWYGRGYWSAGHWYGTGAPYHYAAPRGGPYVPPGGGAHGTFGAPHGGASYGGHAGGGVHVGGGHH